MAGLTADIDFRPRGLVSIVLKVVVLFKVRRMALGTHSVPVLTGIGPVQPISRVNGRFRIQVVPHPRQSADIASDHRGKVSDIAAAGAIRRYK